MRKITLLFFIICITSACSHIIYIPKKSVNIEKLTGKDYKCWSIAKDGINDSGTSNWLFRTSGTLSYYHKDKKNKVEIIEWFGNDIQLENKGHLPFTLNQDTIFIAKNNFHRVLRLTNDSLWVETTYTSFFKYPKDTILFVHCKTCFLSE